MARKKKAPDETYPVKLTEKQRTSLVQSTRLRRGIKQKLKDAPAGTQLVRFTKKELVEMGDEIETSLRFAMSSDRTRLNAVLDKLDDILDALEESSGPAARPAGDASSLIYQLRIKLENISPPIWRRVQVPDCTLGDLHAVIQVAMGWDDAHLHQYIVRGTFYGEPADDDFGFGLEVEDEDSILVSEAFAGKGRKNRISYEYDFGDGWIHEIVLERVVEPEPKVHYPRCLEGARACPPEDCGGPWSYPYFLDALADPEHPEHDHYTEWIEDFDPEAFSCDDVNKIFKSLK